MGWWGEAESAILISKFEYTDDVALVAENEKKSKAMHVRRPMRVDATSETDVTTLDFSHNCDSCGLQFTNQRCRSVHMARWCDGDRTQRTFTTLHADRQGCENGQATIQWPRRLWAGCMSAKRHSTTCYSLSTSSASYRATGRTRRMSVTAWSSRSRRSAHRGTCGATTVCPVQRILGSSIFRCARSPRTRVRPGPSQERWSV